jgi:hypothetical protein
MTGLMLAKHDTCDNPEGNIKRVPCYSPSGVPFAWSNWVTSSNNQEQIGQFDRGLIDHVGRITYNLKFSDAEAWLTRLILYRSL